MTHKNPYVRPTRALVDLNALRNNWIKLTEVLPRATRILAVVKANGYGHGSQLMAEETLKLDACGVGVADMAEAVVLREGGFRGDILCLGAALRAALDEASERGIKITLFQPGGLDAVEAFTKTGKPPLTMHVEIESGMHRLGIEREDWELIATRLAANPGIHVEGIFTHLAESENADSAFTKDQLAVFNEAAQVFEKRLRRKLIRHVANSGGALFHTGAQLDWVRPGIALYGYPPIQTTATEGYSPILEWRAPILQIKRIVAGDTVGYNRRFKAVKPMTIATVAVGYGDGYKRGYAGVGVGFQGKRCPVVGTVCMDLLMIDISSSASAQVGDEVILLGRNEDGAPDARELAASQGTIPYEVLTGISARVSREAVRR